MLRVRPAFPLLLTLVVTLAHAVLEKEASSAVESVRAVPENAPAIDSAGAPTPRSDSSTAAILR